MQIPVRQVKPMKSIRLFKNSGNKFKRKCNIMLLVLRRLSIHVETCLLDITRNYKEMHVSSKLGKPV